MPLAATPPHLPLLHDNTKITGMCRTTASEDLVAHPRTRSLPRPCSRPCTSTRKATPPTRPGHPPRPPSSPSPPAHGTTKPTSTTARARQDAASSTPRTGVQPFSLSRPRTVARGRQGKRTRKRNYSSCRRTPSPNARPRLPSKNWLASAPPRSEPAREEICMHAGAAGSPFPEDWAESRTHRGRRCLSFCRSNGRLFALTRDPRSSGHGAEATQARGQRCPPN